MSEAYGLSWPGKADALQAARTPAVGRLRRDPRSTDESGGRHVVVEGDNLAVLGLLTPSLRDRVDLVFVDPPYNTGRQFVYDDDYRDPVGAWLAQTGQVDANGRLVARPSTAGRHHSRWLSMMLPRLLRARDLLAPTGFFVATIDDNEIHHLRLLCDEVFGSDNFVGTAVWQRTYTANQTARGLSDTHDYVVVYARDAARAQVGRVPRTPEQLAAFTNPDDDPRGPWKAENLSAGKRYDAGDFEIVTPTGRRVRPPPNRWWRCDRARYEAWLADGRITFGRSGDGRPMLKKFLSEVRPGLTPSTWWPHGEVGSNKEASLELKQLFGGKAPFDTPKPLRLLERVLELFSPPDGLVLDFFAGSGTTAHAAARMQRRSVSVDLPAIVPTTLARLQAADVCVRALRYDPLSRWVDDGTDLAAQLRRRLDSDDDAVLDAILAAGLPIEAPWTRQDWGYDVGDVAVAIHAIPDDREHIVATDAAFAGDDDRRAAWPHRVLP